MSELKGVKPEHSLLVYQMVLSTSLHLKIVQPMFESSIFKFLIDPLIGQVGVNKQEANTRGSHSIVIILIIIRMIHTFDRQIQTAAIVIDGSPMVIFATDRELMIG